MSSFPMLLQALFGGMGVLVSLVGTVIALLATRRSRWALVLAAGFGLHAVLGLFYRVLPLLMSRGGLGANAYQSMFVVTSLLSVVAMTAIVGGVAGLLSELPTRDARAS